MTVILHAPGSPEHTVGISFIAYLTEVKRMEKGRQNLFTVSVNLSHQIWFQSPYKNIAYSPRGS